MFETKNRYNSILDILGPEMIGPSSSHTAGAVRLGLFAASILNSQLKKVEITLYNSFAQTGIGHGTDKAILAGLLGFEKSDRCIKNSFELAHKRGVKFNFIRIPNAVDYLPNSAKIDMLSDKWHIEVVGASIGGGLIVIQTIDGFEVNFTGDYETLIVTHRDKIGVLAKVLTILSEHKMNVVSINSVRHNKIEDIKTVITLDNYIQQEIYYELIKLPNIIRVRIIHLLQENW